MSRRKRRQGPPRLPRNASPLARFRVREMHLTQAQMADLHGWCLRRYQTIEADFRQMRPYEADHIARRCGPKVGRDIDPYHEFAQYPAPLRFVTGD